MGRAKPFPDSATPSAQKQALEQYRVRASGYDQELAPFEPLRLAAVERLHLQPGETVIDVGCGTGLSFALLRERLGSRGHIVGIEQCPDMLAKARERVLSGGGRVTLVLSPVEEARWTGRADAALFHFTHDILRNPRALDNVLRHLKPGARVVATGLQWSAPWAWPVNLFVMGAALYSVSSLDGLIQPWSLLGERLQEVSLGADWMGGVFTFTGTWSG
jgi:SAM-dependent methyltransferase